MRRRQLTNLPALTHFYGLRPWEIELLTPDELNEYLSQLAARNRAMAAANDRNRRGRH